MRRFSRWWRRHGWLVVFLAFFTAFALFGLMVFVGEAGMPGKQWITGQQ